MAVSFQGRMMARILLFTTLFLLAGSALTHGSEGIRILRGNRVVVLYDAPLETTAEAVAAIYPAVKARLQEIFGWDLDVEPTVRLVADHQRFTDMTRTPGIVAYALPGSNSLVIDLTRANKRPFTLEITLRHELCHLLLHRHIDGSRLPRWLDEGVCQWASDGIGEITPDPDMEILARAVQAGRRIPLRHLENGFPHQEGTLMLAYAESKAFVDFLIAEFGQHGLLALLDRLRAGEGVEEAFLETFGLETDALEGRWWEALGRKTTFLVRMSRHLYEVLFALGALLVICAFIRILRKKRAYLKALDDEESVLH